MTVEEARGYVTDYYLSETHSDEDKFSFVEALHFLIEERNDPNDMHNLAWFYAEERAFDLQLKYLEMAAKQEFFPAYEGLGYYWYYGHGGTVDYEKAFHYFSKGAGSKDDYLRIGCECKLADMYHYGYYVGKDEARYKGIIERLFLEMSNPEDLRTVVDMEFICEPSLDVRVAEIRLEQGRHAEAVKLLRRARVIFAEYLRSNPSWWGNIEEIENVVMRLHENSIDWEDGIDLYDLFWLAREGLSMSFCYQKCRFKVECLEDEGGIAIRFNNRWYRDTRDFFEKAKIGGRPLTALYNDLNRYRIA